MSTAEAAHPPVDGLDLPALRAFFAAHVPGSTGDLDVRVLEGGRSNLTYRVTEGHRAWVLRRPPLGDLTPSAHDMAREHRVVAALADSGVPVPRAVALAGPEVIGVPFLVAEFVEGRVLRSREQVRRLPRVEAARCAFALVDVLARLHALDPAAVGLAGFGRPEGYLARQVRRWTGQWQRVRTRESADVDALCARLAADCPAESGTALVHGDYRIDNAILAPDDPGRVRALVDWEMAALGDPLADLGLHLAYADEAFAPVVAGSAASTSDRLPGPAALAARYAAVTGASLDRLPFYVALGFLKAAVIAEGIHRRHLAGAARGSGFEAVGTATEPLAAAGLRTLGGPVRNRNKQTDADILTVRDDPGLICP
jgi:aminoglycoside phosphotransferase (APT) family kinase protein